MLSLCVCKVIVCESWACDRGEEAGGGGDPGYRIKNKNPTQSCGEQKYFRINIAHKKRLFELKD